VTTFVLVHGAWHGGWVWDDVAEQLRHRGHQPLAPTLPPDPGTTLEDHVRHVHDVVRTAPRPVVLVAHSYAGVVAPQVAALAADRLAALVLVDGWVTGAGQSLLDVAPDWFARWCLGTASGPPGRRALAPPPPEVLGVTDPRLVTRLEESLTAHPLATFTDPATRSLPHPAPPLHAIVCVPATMPFGDLARAAGYVVHEIESHHEVMLSKPRELAGLLDAIAHRPLPGPAGDHHEQAHGADGRRHVTSVRAVLRTRDGSGPAR
jgi:pimeloyl-ACP methyl ester carboxylesterase